MNEGNHRVNESVSAITQINEVESFREIVPVLIQSGINTYAIQKRESTVLIFNHRGREKLRVEETDVTLNIAGKQKIKDLKTESMSINIRETLSSVN